MAHAGGVSGAEGYGFRVDPVPWAASEPTYVGALIRRDVLGEPRPDDAALIAARVEELLARQQPDGSLAATSARGALALYGLRFLGAGRNDRRVARAFRAALKQARAEEPDDEGVDRAGHLPMLLCKVLCDAGVSDHAAVRRALRYYSDHIDLCLAQQRPWTLGITLAMLWSGRGVMDVSAALNQAMTWLERRLERVASLDLFDIWHLIEALSQVGHPGARRCLALMLPAILRAQAGDGSWRLFGTERSYFVLLGLSRHGLLDELRRLPPLPPCWREVRSLPAPGEAPSHLCGDGNLFWLVDGCCLRDDHRAAWEAYAIDPADGRVVRRFVLPRRPGMTSLSCWDQRLVICAGGRPPRLYQLDPATGAPAGETALEFAGDSVRHVVQVGDELLVAEAWPGPVWAHDPRRPGLRQPVRLSGASPLPLAWDGHLIWSLDAITGLVTACRRDSTLVDWASSPVPPNPHRAGLAVHEGGLWALDTETRRLVLVERTGAG